MASSLTPPFEECMEYLSKHELSIHESVEEAYASIEKSAPRDEREWSDSLNFAVALTKFRRTMHKFQWTVESLVAFLIDSNRKGNETSASHERNALQQFAVEMIAKFEGATEEMWDVPGAAMTEEGTAFDPEIEEALKYIRMRPFWRWSIPTIVYALQEGAAMSPEPDWFYNFKKDFCSKAGAFGKAMEEEDYKFDVWGTIYDIQHSAEAVIKPAWNVQVSQRIREQEKKDEDQKRVEAEEKVEVEEKMKVEEKMEAGRKMEEEGRKERGAVGKMKSWWRRHEGKS